MAILSNSKYTLTKSMIARCVFVDLTINWNMYLVLCCESSSKSIFFNQVRFLVQESLMERLKVKWSQGWHAGRGVRGAVWFGFEAKNHPNRKMNKYAVWFGSIDF